MYHHLEEDTKVIYDTDYERAWEKGPQGAQLKTFVHFSYYFGKIVRAIGRG